MDLSVKRKESRLKSFKSEDASKKIEFAMPTLAGKFFKAFLNFSAGKTFKTYKY